MFPTFDLHDWLTDIKADTTYDLTNSGLTRPGGRDYTGVVPPQLRDLDHPTAPPPLEDRLANEYGVSPENVLVTCRCQHANFITTATARDLSQTNCSGNVVVEDPTYNPLFKTPEGLGLDTKLFHREPADDFHIDPDRVREAVDGGTTSIVITNRHNPTGQVTPRDTLAELAEIAVHHEAYLHVDEVYSPFFLDSPETSPAPFGGVTAAGLPNTVVTNSMTKFFGLYEISLGWIIADESFIDRARVVEHHTNAVAKPSRALATRALAHQDTLTANSHDRLETRTAKLQEFLDTTPSLTAYWNPPGIIAFVTHQSVDGNTFVTRAREAGIALQPGRFFSPTDRLDDYFRIAVGQDEDQITTGLTELHDLCETITD